MFESHVRAQCRSKRLVRVLLGLLFAASLVACAYTALRLLANDFNRRQVCRDRLRLIVAGLATNAEAGRGFPRGTVHAPGLPPEQRLSWYLEIIGFSDTLQSIRYLFRDDLPWNSKENCYPDLEIYDGVLGTTKTSRSVAPPAFPFRSCPQAAKDASPGLPGLTAYVGIAGLGSDAPTLPRGHARAGVFGFERQTRLEDITDGTSTTLVVAETLRDNGPWTAGGVATVRGVNPLERPYIGTRRQFGGAHRGGVFVGLADGSVRFVRETVDPKVFEALSTIAGAERVPDGWYD